MNYEEEDFGKRYLWDLLPDDTVRLLRVYTQGEKFRVPEQIEGKIVTVIGAYCFAEAEHLQGYECRESLSGEISPEDRSMPAMAGKIPERLCLPDSVHTIEDLAFYNCRVLKSLEIGPGIQQLGSDVFMNCSALEEIILRCGVEEASGINLVLSRISAEILVHFLGGKHLTRRSCFIRSIWRVMMKLHQRIFSVEISPGRDFVPGSYLRMLWCRLPVMMKSLIR